MTAHFFVTPDQVGGGVAVLGPEDSRHLVTVLRARRGDAVTVSDGAGTVWAGRYDGDGDGGAIIALGEASRLPRRRPSLVVVHALPKQRKLDEVVQRLTEIGVDRIVPVHSERSQVELDERKAAKAVARWRAIALAAAKQSKRAWLPVVDDVGVWVGAFADAAPGIVCWEESNAPLHAVLDRIERADELTVGIGPEGGLTAQEVTAARLPHASLGPTVLRTETAAVVAVAAVSYHFGLMEPS